MLTRLISARVNLLLTSSAIVSRQTVADEFVDIIFTRGSIQTRVRIAFVHVGQTTSVKIAFRTSAFEAVGQVVTLASVGTRLAGAFIDVDFTMASGKAGSTFTVL